MRQSELFSDDRPPLDKVIVPEEVRELLQREDATCLVSSSGGKDSDCMLRLLVELHRRQAWSSRLLAIHSDLGKMEWHESLPHCRSVCEELGVELEVVTREGLDLLDAIEARRQKRPDAPPFPSSAARYCTAGWKRDVINRWIRHNIGPGEACVSAMGLRADESRARAKKPVWQIRAGANSEQKHRTVLEWNPILQLSLSDVWEVIGYTPDELADWQTRVATWRAEGLQGPLLTQAIVEAGFRAHPAYAMGNERVSCAMCVLASASDLANGAEARPDTFKKLREIEARSGFNFQQKKPLAVSVDVGQQRRRHRAA